MEEFERQSAASAELQHGEHLVWLGQPSGTALTKTKWPVFIFGIPWTAFSLFWVGMAFFMTRETGEMIGMIFPLFGLPFIGIGIWMLASPFRAAKKAKRTVYAITNLRAIIITLGTSKNVQSYYQKDIADIRRTEKPDGSGNLYFASGSGPSSDNNPSPGRQGFLGIPEVRVVEMFMRDFLRKEQNSGHNSFPDHS